MSCKDAEVAFAALEQRLEWITRLATDLAVATKETQRLADATLQAVDSARAALGELEVVAMIRIKDNSQQGELANTNKGGQMENKKECPAHRLLGGAHFGGLGIEGDLFCWAAYGKDCGILGKRWARTFLKALPLRS